MSCGLSTRINGCARRIKRLNYELEIIENEKKSLLDKEFVIKEKIRIETKYMNDLSKFQKEDEG